MSRPTALQLTNKRLAAVKPPSKVSRTPRDMETQKMWKASEYRNWLYYSLALLDGIILPQLLKYLALLVQAIYSLNQDSITDDEMIETEELLLKFVQQYEEILKITRMTFNLHLLTHLVQTVRNWGGLWVHTTSPFESWNRHIMDTVTSPKDRALQVATRFLLRNFVLAQAYNTDRSQEF